MDIEIDAFIAEWMRRNTHLLEEVVLLQGDNPSTEYGAALHAYLDVADDWTPDHAKVRANPH